MEIAQLETVTHLVRVAFAAITVDRVLLIPLRYGASLTSPDAGIGINARPIASLTQADHGVGPWSGRAASALQITASVE